MKFKYSAIGKDTAENRKWLEKLGYYIPKIASKCDLLFTTSTGNVASLSNKNKGFLERDDSFIDCTHSDALFQAITAIREDSDYMQLFYIDVICGIGGQMVGSEPKKRFWFICKYEKQRDAKKMKASLEELQNHFKINK